MHVIHARLRGAVPSGYDLPSGLTRITKLPGSIAISLYRARFLQSYHDVMASMSVVVPPSMMKQLLRLLAWRIPIDGSKTRDASERERPSTISAITT